MDFGSDSDESETAPREFHITTTTTTSYENSLPRCKCKLCQNLRQHFYCTQCVEKGLFHHTHTTSMESFSVKRKALVQLQDGRRSLEKKCLKLMSFHLATDSFYTKIRMLRDRNKLLKLAVEDATRRVKQKQTLITDLNQIQGKFGVKIPRCRTKVDELKRTVATKRIHLDDIRQRLINVRGQIQKFVHLRIEQLKYVFPIEAVQPKLEEDEVVRALADATQTTYIWNRWEYSTQSGELQFSIVEPTLPGSGNYSRYNIWVSQNKDLVPTSGGGQTESSAENPAFNIGAALTYAAQLTQILAFYLNIRLPYRIQYSDFCAAFLPEVKFRCHVARLNANILYLCYTQQVDLSQVRACETIRNLLKILDTKNVHLGGGGPYTKGTYKSDLIEDCLSEDLMVQLLDEDSDEGGAELLLHTTGDWETVPHIQCPEAAPIVGHTLMAQLPSQIISTTSMAGGLVNSIASIWKGFSGR